MTDRELMHQALNALEWNLPVLEDYGDKEQLQRQHKAITALRDRLTQPKQELVFDCPRCGHCCPQRPWVGLTDEEIDALHMAVKVRLMGTFDIKDIYRSVEEKLKEKNT